MFAQSEHQKEIMRRLIRLLCLALVAAIPYVACDPAVTVPENNNNNNNENPNNGGNDNPAPVSNKPSLEIQQADYFAQNALSTYYLWSREVKNSLARLDPDTCKTPIPVVKAIRYHQRGKEVDHWTQLTNNLGEMTSSVEGIGETYGYDLTFGRITNKEGVYFIIVTYVVKDSPAEKGGLRRGDLIMTIDGKEITAANIYDVFNKASVKLGIAHLTSDGYLGSVEKEVSLTAVDMWEDPVLLSKTFDVNGKKVGYLVYNSFDIKSMETLPDVFRQFKADGIQELILDLRYNGGGFVNTECELASLIAPVNTVAAGDVFQTEVYNDVLMDAWKDDDFNTYFSTKFSYKNDEYDINVDISDANPGVTKLYAIVTSGSASASEGLLVGLAPYLDITLIGEQTYGKYCAGYMMSPKQFYPNGYEDYYTEIEKWGIYVMVSKFADKNGDNPAMPDGIPVNIEVYDNPLDGYQFGDEEETMLKAALTAAGKVYTKAPLEGRRFRYETEWLEHGAPKGMLIKSGLPSILILHTAD